MKNHSETIKDLESEIKRLTKKIEKARNYIRRTKPKGFEEMLNSLEVKQLDLID